MSQRGIDIKFPSLIITGLLLLGISLPKTISRQTTPIPGVFYAVIWHYETRDTAIVEIDYLAQNSQQIFTLSSSNPQTPNSLFPEYEKMMLDKAIEVGNLPEGRGDEPSIMQSIASIWLLDQNHLLIQTRNEIMYAFPTGTCCLGYHEFLILDLTTGETTSLLKSSYHNELIEDWGCVGYPVFVDTVRINPVQDKFVFSLKTIGRCAEYLAQTYLVDYSVLPVTVTDFSQTDGLSWSPDGNYLAYYQRDPENCSPLACNVSVNILSMIPASTPIIIMESPLFVQRSHVTVWIDNSTVFYQWADTLNGGSEEPLIWSWHDIFTHSESTSETRSAFNLTSTFRLEQTQTNLLAVNIRDQLFSIAIPEEPLFEEILSSVHNVFYNDRYPRYLFANLDDAKNIIILDGDLNQQTLNLSSFVPDENEYITFVAPGE